MRSIATRLLVSATAVVGLAAGGLAGASASSAAAASHAKLAVVTQEALVQSNNLGLNTERAMNWQRWLKHLGQNPGTIDGILGSDSWKAAQREFGFTGSDVDGIVGPKTIKGLQKHLNYWGGYGLAEDGVFGSATKAAFWDFNAA
ncbi:peptidoglycan-binding protein [Streptomyces somaliensis DSM 40738]|uniref:Peptidoglycan-binding protein n=1 Tax=Streptomyces somaliensis (strain ATCC 33201 / DSM 40738 / JCM 12659 / KCTC 9044 / NCTC 11332 / NRRL B-12077 / IP 733) TaxID=1134445 RepID=A0AA44DCM5_STRE0|nr:peptidoglycan-binding protein [Streptomyces somaliensis]MCQ0021833.1 peptidoglycan-binding protein [Streptomyces somaliensis DSM 40738]NKY13797.1 peptidoglycan-binding protein [Streptomyces somaliensis DSM 40738]